MNSTWRGRIPQFRRAAAIATLAATLGIATSLLCASASAQSASQDGAAPPVRAPAEAAKTGRPRIGVVLSGGGARGLTHIGVLKVLEELRVPIDYLTATSMGAIVGGLYVSGMPLDEMERMVTALDWPAFFSDQPPRRDLSVRRNVEDAAYTIPLELGFRDFSFKLSTGALSGQNLELLLHGLTWRDDDIGSFDRLPIPFRAVATNLIDGKPVVFDRGPLYIAMRGSMSVPGIFAPLDIGGKMLGDGGLVKNLPVDIVKAMGAEVVIAINIGTPLRTREQLSSFVGVAQQSINILTEQNVLAQRALLVPGRDVLIEPDLGELSATDFGRGEQFIALGEKAARASADALSRYALPPDAYAAFRTSLHRVREPDNPLLAFTEVRGTELTNPAVLEAQVGLSAGAKIELEQVPRDISILFGRGDFERIDYELAGREDSRDVAFLATEKSWGPNYLRFGVGFASDTQGDNAFGARVRHRRTWLNSLGAEWINDVELGTTNLIRTELFQPLNLAQTWFATAYASAARYPTNLFVQGAKIAEYGVLDERVGVNLGYAFGTWGELRIGPRFLHLRADPTVDSPSFAVTKEDEWGLALLGRIDTQDNAFFPRHGLRLSLTGFAGTQRQGGVDRTARRAEIDAHQSIPLGDRDALNLGLRAAGTDAFEPGVLNAYRLGGFLELSGLRTNELDGAYLGRARAVYLHRVGALPVFGNTYFVGASLEIGNVWMQRSAISLDDTLKAGSVFFAADTPLGPFYVAWGHASGGRSTWYLLLGRP